MDDIKIIDNLLPTVYQDAIEQMFLSKDFNWHYVSDVTDQTYKNIEGYVSNDGFAHMFIGPKANSCLLYTSPSPRDGLLSRMPSSA